MTEGLYVLPTSFGQRRLFFLDQLAPGNPAYNISAGVRITGSLDEAALHRALLEIVRRHETLRTTFVAVDGEPMQVVAEEAALDYRVVDLRSVETDATRDSELVRLASETSRVPFDLSRGPLLRVRRFVLADREGALVFVMHHIVSDVWSVGVFLRELLALYDAFHTGARSPLADFEIQYADYAAWQAGWVQEEEQKTQLSYWKRQLAGELPRLELPSFGRPASGDALSSRGARKRFLIDPDLARALNRTAQAEGVTLFMLLLAAFDALLHRYTGQEELVVGTAIANRTREELEGLIGFFVNTLVMRIRVSGEEPFRDVLARVRESAVDAYSNQDLPFDKLVEELQPERAQSENPICRVMFALQNAPLPELTIAGLALSEMEVDRRAAPFDLSIFAREVESGILLIAEFRADVLDADTVEGMLTSYRRLLEGAVSDPSLRLSELPLMNEPERAELLSWSRVKRDFPREKTLPAVFAELARETPDAWAVEMRGERLRYRELDERSNEIARSLASRGIGRGARVGILGPRSVHLYAAALGIAKAGSAYVPLDPSYPRERLAFMVEDAGLSAILAERDSADRLAAPNVPLLYWDERKAPNGARAPEGPRSSDDLAYVIYTSGSTGVPKGVAVSHRAVLRLVSNTNYIELSPRDRVAQAASFSFDAATFELWGGLLSGACVVGIEKNAALDAGELGRELKEKEISVLFLTTALFNQTVREAPEALRSLRVLLFGGEQSDAASVRALLEGGGPDRLLHVYGPTESTTFASFHEVRSLSDGHSSVPIGAPLANTELYVLDARGNLCPRGVEGELFIGGDGLAHGYWNRPERTAESFVPDPFGSAGGRLYKTGDRVRWLENGALEFLGRADAQVKVRGHRIELGEVEAALRGQPGVRDAAAMVREDRPGDRRLVGYFVANGEPVSPSDLRRSLSETLPEFMVPQDIEEVAAIPLTVNGKIDREALPAPLRRADTGVRSGEPRGPIEDAVAEIWKDILGLEQAGVEDVFFESGGHSLLAMRLLTRAREVFRCGLPLRGFFEEPTIAGLARMIEASRRDGHLPAAPPLLKASSSEAIPLSYAQQRLWLLEQIAGVSPAYHVSAAVSMKGELVENALRASLDEIVSRHDALRTSFRVVDETPFQVVQSDQGLPLPVVDLSGLGREAREDEVRRQLRRRARQLFDLSRAPLMRALLLKLGSREHVLQLTMHHIVADGWSVGILFEELSALYESFSQGGASPLEPLDIQYPDYAVWQRNWLGDEALRTLSTHWKEKLTPYLAGSELPPDRPRRAVDENRGARGGRETLAFPPELSRDLREWSRSEGVTLYTLLLAGFQSLLHLWTGSDRVVVGAPIANRGASATEKLIGFFANTLALAVDLSGGPTFRDALARVRDATLDAYSHQDVPFEKIVEALSPERDWAKNPLFQITFALHTTAFLPPRLPGLVLEGVESSAGATRFDLEIHLWSGRDGITAVANYDRDLFDSGSIARLLESYRALLESALRNPDQAVAELSLVPASEMKRLLSLSGTRTEYPRERTIPSVFADRVKEHPERIAVAFGSETLTYRELDRRAEGLARRLTALGVGPEGLVGVLGERSVSLYVAVLAVAKAGGAYVPLDPKYPRERLRFMIEDSGLAALLVDAKSRHLLPATDVAVVDFHEESSVASQAPFLSPENLAYVMYTSGSTGTPKGVGITHRAVLRLVFNRNTVELGPDDRIAQVASFSFDAATFELWGALLRGGRVVGFEKSLALEPRAFGRELSEQGVTAMFLTTSLFKVLVREANETLRGVQSLLVGGEAVDADTARASLEDVDGGPPRLVNGYGPTESTTFAAFGEVRRVPDGLRTIPIGFPLDNTELHVVSDALTLCPIGVEGELFIGGDGLARGYWRRPELTAERFVPNPWGTPGSRLYRTGDRVKRLAGGEIEYLGRFDSQVKLRGYRIELGEVEATLRREGSFKDVIVVVRPDTSGEARLVGYVVPEEGESAASAGLREALLQKLPDYMVPQAIVSLAALPLNANGKVDREALPEPGTTRVERVNELRAPRDPFEEGLAEIWRDLLDVDRISIQDDFFRIGGHSLAATQVVSRVNKAFRVKLQLRHLFEDPTIEGLAARIAALHGDAVRDSDAPRLARASASESEGQALSFAQQRLWFLAELDPESAAYNIPSAFRLEGALDVPALGICLLEIRRRHEVLRTSFQSDSGRAISQVRPLGSLDPNVPIVDLEGLDEDSRETEARRLTALETRTVFDLASGSLLRARVVRLGPRDHLLLLTIHHVVFDGWSRGILFRELEHLYRGRLDARCPVLPELPLQYADYAAWQRERLSGPLLAHELSYWRSQLEDLTVLNLPTD